MLLQFILPRKFVREEVEAQIDHLALKFQRTYDKKIITQISALNRVLAKMDSRICAQKKDQ